MKKSTGSDTPFLDALAQYVKQEVSPFDVPGHHMGNLDNRATEVFGKRVYRCDLNAPIGLDNLAHPSSVLLESERMTARVCHADEAFYLIDGTSSGIIAMFLTAVKAGEKVILPRNVHKSIISALILCGAVPVYVAPEIDEDLGIANQPSMDTWKKAILRNSSAKAIFVINPTYFGSVGPLKELTDFAHEHGMAVLVDEAHGAHYYFHVDGAPQSAMDAGADLSSVSFHKTAGSLTQSSVLLLKGNRFTRDEIQTSLNIINTTSPSSLLIGSLEGAASFMGSDEGRERMREVYELADYAEQEIRSIPGFSVAGKEHFEAHGSYIFDRTKLVIALDKMKIDGFTAYRELKKTVNVQMELAEPFAILGILALGTKKEHIDRLVKGLRQLSARYYDERLGKHERPANAGYPFSLARPRVAFNAPGKVVALENLEGEISREQVMMYPPGIPLIVPGEVWTRNTVEEVRRIERSGGVLISSHNDGFEIIDRTKWKRYFVYEKKLVDYLEKRKTYPLNDGFTLPFEGNKHERTFVLMPFRKDTWRNGALPAREAFKQVIAAIAEHEPVTVGIHPRYFKEISPMFDGMKNVELLPIRYNDSWARDNLPLFLSNGKAVRAVDFRFNAWGGEVDGLYRNYADDDRISSILAKKMKLVSYRHPSFVLEGGSIATDGEGTLLTTEACLLSAGRNPNCSKEEIEDTLKEYLGVEKVLWLPHGIYEDETNEHVDNMVAFVRPGEVVMAWTNDKNDPQYDYCQATYRALKKATDAKGRSLVIHKCPVPSPALTLTEAEAKGLGKSSTTLDLRNSGRRLAASYINFYLGETFVILPAFGVKEDAEALKIMTRLFPTRKIHQVYTREILLGGGNIHCITMNMPYLGGQNL